MARLPTVDQRHLGFPPQQGQSRHHPGNSGTDHDGNRSAHGD
jgi:hypothetical protein